MPINATLDLDIAYLQEKWESEQARMQHAEKRLDIYNDNYLTHLHSALKGQFSEENYNNIKLLPDTHHNILKRIVRQAAALYKKAPKRRLYDPGGEPVDSEGSDARRWEELERMLKLDAFMQEANRKGILLNDLPVLVAYKPRLEKIKLHSVPGSLCEVRQDPEDLTEMIEFVYQVARSQTLPNQDDDTDREFILWSLAEHWRLDGNWEKHPPAEDNEEGENPYRLPGERRVIPVAMLRTYIPDGDEFWNWTLGTDLVDGSINIAVLLTLFKFLQKVCSIIQKYVIGDTEKLPERLLLDPLTPLIIEPTGNEKAEVGILNTAAYPFMEIRNSIVQDIVDLAGDYGISPENFMRSAEKMSAEAMELSQRELDELREAQKLFFKPFEEEELFPRIRAVNNHHFSDKKISDELVLRVDYPEIREPKQDPETWRMDMEKVQKGVLSIVDVVRKYNPDLAEQEAEKQIVDNRKKNQELGFGGVSAEGSGRPRLNLRQRAGLESREGEEENG